MLPDAEPSIVEAVRLGGGSIGALDDATRGIVWVAADGDGALEAVLARHPGIEWVQLPWAGVDAFAQVLAAEASHGSRRIWTSAKGAYAQPVAEHALALALAVLREFPMRARATTWQADERGRSLFGASVTVLGAGGIAVELLRLLEPFGVRTTVVRRDGASRVPGAHATVGFDRLGEALADAEVLFVAAALTEQTRGMIDADALSTLPEGAVVVNVARGAIIDAAALDASLRAGHLGGAGLDVTDPEPLPAGHPLWSAPNCLITPHVADTVEMTTPLFARRVTENTAAFVSGGPLRGVVDPVLGY
ncbi:hydroxyacid dehydrogenase [Agromyces intestinalis]|uniref:Hydroxyacid dehydrogenase n=1 Tax=Agromyces intestinalis TaxID=2592652 RepID=A0A5C1YLG4_9MICO|nr:hydroxyacid dehydrogenase [Agromyces intestinalis]